MLGKIDKPILTLPEIESEARAYTAKKVTICRSEAHVAALLWVGRIATTTKQKPKREKP